MWKRNLTRKRFSPPTNYASSLIFRDAEIPMIPLGLKETKEIDFREPFKDFILEHYSEDGHDYENAIAEFMDVRQAMRTPTRDQNGIALLFEHFNQLYYVERRFFPPDRSLGIFFEWYVSISKKLIYDLGSLEIECSHGLRCGCGISWGK